MKKTLFIFLIFPSLFWSQNTETDSDIIFRKKFVSIKNVNSLSRIDDLEKIILTNDTLVNINPITAELNLEKPFPSEELIKVYQYSVFSPEYRASKKNRKKIILKQWNVPIIIHIDKSIPKNLKKSLKKFIKSIPALKNLSVSLSNDKSKANYHIVNTNRDLNEFYRKAYKGLDEKAIKDLHQSDIFYKLLSQNSNDKFYGAKLEINLDNILDEKKAFSKLKHNIFGTLGRFKMYYNAPKNSLLNTYSHVNNPVLNEFDINILRLHYNKIYNFPVDEKVFTKMIEKHKSLK